MEFFDIRDLFRIGKRRRLRLGLWLIAVIALTLWLFYQNYREAEQSAYFACVVASLVFFAAELVWIFLKSDRRITPLLLFLAVFYLVRNSQFLLLLFGVSFDVHHLVMMRAELKSAIVLTSVGNIWAGFAGIVATVPQKELPPATEAPQDRVDRHRLFVLLCVGGLLTGAVAYVLAILRFTQFLSGGMAAVDALNARLPLILPWLEALFVPFGFAAVAFYGKERFGAAAIGALTGYFLLTLVCGSLPLGAAGLFATVCLICLTVQPTGKRAQTIGIFAAIGVLLLLLSLLATLLREPNGPETFSLRSIAVNAFTGIGYSCFALLAALRIVPSVEQFRFGREYAEALLGGILPPEADSYGIFARLTADTRVWDAWGPRYFSEVTAEIGFSPDAEAYLNFGCFGFLAIFVICTLIAFFLNRYRRYGQNSCFPKYAACVLLYACLTFSYRGGSAVLRMLLWGVLLMALAIHWCGKRKT
ncbi:MAG TPA: hypothetical protein DDW30_03785 [Clostridiales bacterium]|nr:hypothetical protein [Clostridiales bacterium]